MQADLNFVMPTALAFGALVLLAVAIASHGYTPDSGLLLLPDTAQFGASLS